MCALWDRNRYRDRNVYEFSRASPAHKLLCESSFGHALRRLDAGRGHAAVAAAGNRAEPYLSLWSDFTLGALEGSWHANFVAPLCCLVVVRHRPGFAQRVALSEATRIAGTER